MFCTRLSCGHGRAVVTVALILRLTWGSAVVTAFAQSPPAEGEQAAVAELRKVAANIQFHRDGTARFVRLSTPNVRDEHLEQCARLPHLEYLAVVAPGVTDRGVSHLAALTKLDTLLLCGTAITDESLTVVAQLPNLQRLYLDDTAVTDAGLAQLARCRTLKVLSLRATMITTAGIAHLEPLAELEALLLDGTAVDDAALASIAKLPALRSLSLRKTHVRGEDLAPLTAAQRLEVLNLTGCPIGGLDTRSLAGLPRLKTLNLHQTGVAAADTAELATLLRQRNGDVFGADRPWRGGSLDIVAGEVHAAPEAVAAASISDVLPPANVRFAPGAMPAAQVPDFQRHVVALLGRLGCNGRACHGSFQGQGGFRLSMFGYDFAADHQALRAGETPRVNLSSPAESLILNKPTSADEHGGGQRFAQDGWEYRLLKAWIEGGAKPVAPDAARFVRLEVTPAELVFASAGESRQLRVVAVWSDGSREDVIPLTRFQSNDESVATVTADGLVQSTGAGDTHVVCFYDNGVQPIPVMRPVSERTGDRFPDVPAPTPIDQHINAKLAKLGIVPSELCTDEEFLRRASLDLIGTLPTPAEIKAFLADRSPDKRARKIDELLERPAYVAWWTVRLCDLTGANAGYLGSTEMASVVAEQWRAWIERRVRDNVGWDQIAQGIVLATSRDRGQPYEDYVVQQSGFTGGDNPADFTALNRSLPHYWHRSNQGTPSEKALAFGYVFLGVRLQCAECHKHPFDQWSQQDFQQFREFFTRIKTGVAPDAGEAQTRLQEMLGVPTKLNTAASRRQSYLRIAAEGRPIPWTEVYIAPPPDTPQPARLLGGPELDLSGYDDPREPLAAWLTHKDNPYFAKAFVNRVWANYFNRGIIEPPDDLNLANPPSNGPLLDYLTRQFIAHGYDMKWLHREILSSHAYQRSGHANETNRDDTRNFSRAVVRRLPAEVVVDAIHQATANQAALAQVNTNVTGRKIGLHPRSYQARVLEYALLVFGKPLRTTNCDCERQHAPTLLQSLYLRNDEEIYTKLRRSDGWLTELMHTKKLPPADELINEAFLRTLSRLPDPDELADCRQYFAESQEPTEAMADLLWVLLNTHEFATNH